MATYTNNATLSYTYAGGGTQQTQSNDVITTMQDVFSLTVRKTASPETYRVGENIAYLVQVTNTGSLPLTTVVLADDLANGQLSYVPGSAQLVDDAIVTALTPTTTDPLAFALPQPLAVGETVTLVYLSRVSDALTTPLPDITNTVTGSAAGADAVSDSATITAEQYASLSIVKAADRSEVAPGDTLNYSLTITNSGTLPAESVYIEDVLPANIASVDAVYLSVDGGPETASTNYSYDPTTRLFVLPSTGTQSILAGGTLTVRIQSTVGTPV